MRRSEAEGRCRRHGEAARKGPRGVRSPKGIVGGTRTHEPTPPRPMGERTIKVSLGTPVATSPIGRGWKSSFSLACFKASASPKNPLRNRRSPPTNHLTLARLTPTEQTNHLTTAKDDRGQPAAVVSSRKRQGELRAQPLGLDRAKARMGWVGGEHYRQLGI